MSAVGTVVFDRDNTSNGSEGTSTGFVNLPEAIQLFLIKMQVLTVQTIT